MNDNRKNFAGKRWVPKGEMEQGEKRSSFRKDGDSRNSYQKKDGRNFEKKKWEEGKSSFRGEKRDFHKKEEDRPFYRNDRKMEEQDKRASMDNNQQTGGEDELPFLLIGRNAVREAIKSGRSIDRILVNTEHDGSLGEIVTMAKDAKMVIREVDRKKLDEVCMPFGHGGKTANHQGVVAYAAGVEYCSVQDILKKAKEKKEDPFIIVLDGVEDPHNLGSIIRSAECAGAHGVVIGKRRSASVTAAAVKAAAGATSYVNVARVTNVTGALEEMKRAGLWIAGADMSGKPMHSQGMNGPLAIVIGSEGNGLTKLVKDTCDFLVSIPMFGQINSLNAGVAAGILMFEKKRQDNLEEA